MSLIDTLDGMLMLWSYSWAKLNPERKIFFNFYLTTLSGTIALLVGLIETLGCLQDKLNLQGNGWNVIGAINDHFEVVGYSIVGLFAFSTLIAVFYFKFCLVIEKEEEGNNVNTTMKSLQNYGVVERSGVDDDEDGGFIHDKFTKLSSVRLVKYLRANTSNHYLASRGAMSLLRGRVRDVANLFSHKDLVLLCRGFDEGRDEQKTT